MTQPSDPKENVDPPVKNIDGKDYQGRTTKEKCIDGVVHILTVDVYCCPFEEVVVSDQLTNRRCS